MRTYKEMPKRASVNAILCKYANFMAGKRINLVNLRTPYADGTKYVVDDDTQPVRSIKGFRTLSEGLDYFDKSVKAPPLRILKIGSV